MASQWKELEQLFLPEPGVFPQYDFGPSLQTSASAFSEHLRPLMGRCNESSSADLRKNMAALHFDRRCCSSEASYLLIKVLIDDNVC